MIPQCKLPSNVTCNSCKSQGHIASVCTKSSSARASYIDSKADSGALLQQLPYSPNPPVASSFYVPQHQQFNQPTPELPLWLAPAYKPGLGMLVSCLPDTGCTQTIISADLANQLKVHVDTSAGVQLLTANGDSMDALWQAQLYMQLKDKTTTTFVSVASQVSHSALISWHDLKYLGVISSSFPHTQCSLVTNNQLREEMLLIFPLLIFPTVYRDSISVKPIAGNPVHIHLKENAVPYRVSVARHIPLRFQDQANKTIQQLLDSKIIAKCDTPSA